MEDWTREAIHRRATKEFWERWKKLENTAEGLGLEKGIVHGLVDENTWAVYRDDKIKEFEKQIQDNIINQSLRGDLPF